MIGFFVVYRINTTKLMIVRVGVNSRKYHCFYLADKQALPIKLMLVDDEQDIARVLELGLKQKGYAVDVFNDPKIALDHFKPDYYDRIILDIRMPNMNGFELARKIWATDPDANVCFLTAFEIHESEAKTVFASHKDHCFVTKPIRVNDLIEHIEKHQFDS